MREIKFRLWNDYDKKMLNWSYLLERNLANIFTLPSYKKWLMQYTGLKDKNGKEIYEGDVLQDKDCIYKVIFEYGSFDGKIIEVLRNVGTQKGMTYQLSFIISDNDNIKVIGNIYENPELLEENK